MARKKRSRRPTVRTKGRATARAAGRDGRRRFDPTVLGLWLLVLLPPLVVIPGLADSFRLPKQAISELFALLSIVLLAFRLGRRARVEPKRLLRAPAVRAAAPLLLVATLGLLWSEHASLVASRLPSLWIGAACLVVWAALVTPRERWLLLSATLVPGTLLALVGIAQFHQVYLPFAFADRVTERLAVTSLAGGAFDLAAYLVLPILCAQALLPRLAGRRRWLAIAALVPMVYCLLLTQTLTALGAAALSSLVLWWPRLRPSFAAPERRRTLAAVAVVAVLGLGVAAAAIEPLRERVVSKLDDVRAGDVDRLVSGRLDGWRAALWMVGQEPLTGVGHGAFRAEFGDARLALRARGVKFFRGQQNPFFVNAHSEPLEVAAELGLPGLAAMLWAAWMLATRLVKPATASADDSAIDRSDDSVGDAASASGPLSDPVWRLRTARAAWASIALLALVDFPFHLALLAFPWLLLAADAFDPASYAPTGAAS